MATTADRPPLTARQAEVLTYVEDYAAEHGYAPGYPDICAEFGFASRNAADHFVRALRRKGYLRPQELGGTGRRGRQRSLAPTHPRGVVLPFLGPVAAGPALDPGEPAAARLDLRDLFAGDDVAVVRCPAPIPAHHLRAGDCLLVRPVAPGDAGRTVVAATAGGAIALYDYLPHRNREYLLPRAGGKRVEAGDGATGPRLLGVWVGMVRRD